MRNSIKAVLGRLKEIEKQVSEFVNTCNSEERLELLESELEAIQAAIESLEEIE